MAFPIRLLQMTPTMCRLILLISLQSFVVYAAEATVDAACSPNGEMRAQNADGDDHMPDEISLLQQLVRGRRIRPSSGTISKHNSSSSTIIALSSPETEMLAKPPLQLLASGAALLDDHEAPGISTPYSVERKVPGREPLNEERSAPRLFIPLWAGRRKTHHLRELFGASREKVELPNDIRQLLTIVSSFTILVSLAGCMWWSVRALFWGTENRYQSIMGIALLFEIARMTSLSVIIPCSLDLTLHLGYDSLYSGVLIGAGYVLTIVSSIFCRWVSMSWNQQQMRALILSMALIGVLSSLLYAIAALPPVPCMNWKRLRMSLLIFSRLAAGLVQVVPLRMMMTRVTPGAVLVGHSMYVYAAVSLGSGAGLFLSSITSTTLSATDIEEKASYPLLAMAAIWALIAFFVWVGLPSDLTALLLCKCSADKEDCMVSKAMSRKQVDSKTCTNIGTVQQKARLWKLMTSFGFERSFAVSGLEAAVPMLLETELAYGTSDVGLIAGLAFLAAAPISVIAYRTATRGYCEEVFALPVLTGISIFSTVLLSKPAGVFPLLFGSALIFAMGYAGNGISVGLAMQSGVLNSWFNQDNFVCFNQILQNTFGRPVGPVLARYLIAHMGQGVYVWLQLGLSSLMFICAISAVVLVKEMSQGAKVRRI